MQDAHIFEYAGKKYRAVRLGEKHFMESACKDCDLSENVTACLASPFCEGHRVDDTHGIVWKETP